MFAVGQWVWLKSASGERLPAVIRDVELWAAEQSIYILAVGASETRRQAGWDELVAMSDDEQRAMQIAFAENAIQGLLSYVLPVMVAELAENLRRLRFLDPDHPDARWAGPVEDAERALSAFRHEIHGRVRSADRQDAVTLRRSVP